MLYVRTRAIAARVTDQALYHSMKTACLLRTCTKASSPLHPEAHGGAGMSQCQATSQTPCKQTTISKLADAEAAGRNDSAPAALAPREDTRTSTTCTLQGRTPPHRDVQKQQPEDSTLTSTHVQLLPVARGKSSPLAHSPVWHEVEVEHRCHTQLSSGCCKHSQHAYHEGV